MKRDAATTPHDPVEVRMTRHVQWAEAPGAGAKTYILGQAYAVPRSWAALWWLSDFIERPAVTFTHTELCEAGRQAMDLRAQHSPEKEQFWNIPANVRFLARLDELTRPSGPQEAA